MMTNNHKILTKMLIQIQRWEDGTVRSNYSLTATSHPRPPPSLYRLSRWAAGLAKCDSNHLLLSWTSSISNWSATAVNVLSSWTHLHSSDPDIAFHYNCRLSTDSLDHIFTGSKSGTTTDKGSDHIFSCSNCCNDCLSNWSPWAIAWDVK